MPLALAAQSVPTTAFRRIYRFTDPRQFGVDFFDRRIRARHEVRFAPRHDCGQSLNLMVLAITYSTFDARAVVGYPTPLCIIVAAFMREQKPERLLGIFYRRPQSFGQWYVNWLCLGLIYPILWRAVEFQIWASPDRWIALFVLVMYAALEALFYALVFHLGFYRLVGRLKGKGSKAKSDSEV